MTIKWDLGYKEHKIIKCKKCRKQTEKGESTGKLTYYDKEGRGRQIMEEKIVCWSCSEKKVRK